LIDWITDTRTVAISRDFAALVRDIDSGIKGKIFLFNGSLDEFLQGSIRIDHPASDEKRFKEVFSFKCGHARALFRYSQWGREESPPYLDDIWVAESHRHLLIEYQI
jgi:hypothetical protein